MPRYLRVGAAQMGPISRQESRSDTVGRLITLLTDAHQQGCDLVAFPECALTPFFPHWFMEDQQEIDEYFERELPSDSTRPLFEEARRLGIAFHLGFAELADVDGKPKHFNASILVDKDGTLIGKFRKIHLPGYAEHKPDLPFQNLEKRYFDVGDLGFRAWNALGGVVGMCICNDRRWPETWRMLGLQGAELVVVGYNTPNTNPEHPELDKLTEFHHTLSLQAGAYQNGTWVVAVAKAGNEEGVDQLGHTVVVAPTGEVVAHSKTTGDEVVVHQCDLDSTTLLKSHVFNFAANRRIEHYGLIASETAAIKASDPDGQVLCEPPAAAPPKEPTPAAEETEPLTVDRGGEQTVSITKPKPVTTTEFSSTWNDENLSQATASIQELLAEQYGYDEKTITPAIEKVRTTVAKLSDDAQEELAPPKKTKPAKKKPAAKKTAAKKSAPPVAEDDIHACEVAYSVPISTDVPTAPSDVNNVNVPQQVAVIAELLKTDYGLTKQQAAHAAQKAESVANQLRGDSSLPGAPEAVKPSPSGTKAQVLTAGPTPKTVPSKKEPVRKEPAKNPYDEEQSAHAVFALLADDYNFDPALARRDAERAQSMQEKLQALGAEAEPPAPAKPVKKKPAPPAKPPEEKAVPVVDFEIMDEPPPTIVGPLPDDIEDEIAVPPVGGETVVADEMDDDLDWIQPDDEPEPAAPKEDDDTKEQQLNAPPQPAPATAADSQQVLLVHCPKCDFPMKLWGEHLKLLGRKARCPNCQVKFQLPSEV